MAKEFTVRLKGQALKDLEEISGLCKEAPEALLARAFAEWVELKEDLEDARLAEEALAEYKRTGVSYPMEEVHLKKPATKARKRPVPTT